MKFLSVVVLLLAVTPRTLAAGPNVLLIMTDDQGYGDLGVHGNPVIQTPRIDQLAGEGVRLESFYVCPVCTPTRACLMTGRYNQRTGAIDTFQGRAMMDPAEVTIAELLAQAGYRTGIFGKWHLGDNYPLRACDQGFAESLVHRGGGLAQPSGPPGEGYFDPELLHNGKPMASKGYCTDIFTDAAIDFLRTPGERPWFCYVAYNAPHAPLQLPPEEEALYASLSLAKDRFPNRGYPLEPYMTESDIAKIYGMVSRIDRGVGRMLDLLEELGVARNTIVIFLTDNGPQGSRYNAGMRGAKGTVYEGGIRVPCFIRWPEALRAGTIVNIPTAHIDLLPTILSACKVPLPKHPLDGVDLLPVLTGDRTEPFDRRLFFQWHRGDRPERFRSFAVLEGRYKLVQPESTRPGPFDPSQAKFQLFDLEADPFEQRDIAAENPAIVDRLKTAHERWHQDVCGERDFDPPRIILGTDHDNPTTLTRQDWRGAGDGWDDSHVGHWEVRIGRGGRYCVTLRFRQHDTPSTVHFAMGGVARAVPVASGAESVTITGLDLPEADSVLEASVENSSRRYGVHYVDVLRIDDAP